MQVIYIPRIRKENRRLEDLTQKYINENKPVAFDIDLSKKDSSLLHLINKLKNKSCRIWISTTSVENVRDYRHRKKHSSAANK